MDDLFVVQTELCVHFFNDWQGIFFEVDAFLGDGDDEVASIALVAVASNIAFLF